MNSTATESFQRMFEEIRQACIAPPENQGEIRVIAFVQVIFRVALERGEISGRCGEERHIIFQIGDTPSIDYEFDRGAFRTILAAIAGFTRSQTPSLSQEKKFNFYGDAQEFFCEVDGGFERFHVETFNYGRKRPFRFTIRHLGR